MVDLGRWADEEYRISESVEETKQDISQDDSKS